MQIKSILGPSERPLEMAEIHGVDTERSTRKPIQKMECLTTLNPEGQGQMPQAEAQKWINQYGDNCGTQSSTHGSTFC